MEGKEGVASIKIQQQASQLARLLRNHARDIMLAHVLSSTLNQLPPLFDIDNEPNNEEEERISPAGVVADLPPWPPQNSETKLLLVSVRREPVIFDNPTTTLENITLRQILVWTLNTCKPRPLRKKERTLLLSSAQEIDALTSSEEYLVRRAEEEKDDDKRDLSVIFKTNQTQALLNDDFPGNPSIKTWVKKYCKDHDDDERETTERKERTKTKTKTKTRTRNITRIHVSDVSFRRIYCEHVFAGMPFVIEGAADDWPAVQTWDVNQTWSKILSPTTNLNVDNGVENSWGGGMTVGAFEKYIIDRRSDVTFGSDAESALQRPPWSSVYAYLHQHSSLDDGRFASDVMWKSFSSPKIFHDNNWFRLMGSCFKMMTVTFWAAHGARQSNHQDDFGSSKWQVQIYGKKRWIMHPPEQSKYLYNGLVDPFRPDLEKYPLYTKATPLEFELNKGDILFWSAGWWHATLAAEDSLAVAQNILNEHNYGEFKRSSQAACRPGGSHGVRSPWCACFRRCYSRWDRMYQEWKEQILNDQPSDFTPSNMENQTPCCKALRENGIQGVLDTHRRDLTTFQNNGNDYDALVMEVLESLREEEEEEEEEEEKPQVEESRDNGGGVEEGEL